MENAVTINPVPDDDAALLKPGSLVQLIDLRNTRQPQLSDAELIRLRLVLDQFDKIVAGCPIARRALAP